MTAFLKRWSKFKEHNFCCTYLVREVPRFSLVGNHIYIRSGRPVTRGAQGRWSPLQTFSPPGKNVLGIVQNCWT